jgi:hypothetical protein
MSIHSLDNFTREFYGGTRPNRFRITGALPAGVGAAGPSAGGALFFDTHCIATTLPESIVGIIPIPFRGRVYKFAGDRTYNEWNITVMDDTTPKDTWGLFHNWSEQFNNHESNLAADRRQQVALCKEITCDLLDHNSDVTLRTVRIKNAWPVQVGPLTLDMNAANQLGTFTVQIAYTHYTIG